MQGQHREPPLLAAFPNRMLNIHPSLLPAFPGLNAQRQALDHGVRFTGAPVHLVTADLDGGPIVLQSAVLVLKEDSVETLSARILVEEGATGRASALSHSIYFAVKAFRTGEFGPGYQ